MLPRNTVALWFALTSVGLGFEPALAEAPSAGAHASTATSGATKQDATPAAPSEEERPRLFVGALSPQGAAQEEAAAMTDAVVASLTERGMFRVLSHKDVQTLLSVERQRQLLGFCGEEAKEDAACTSHLNQMLGTHFILTGALSRVGTAFQLTLETIDTVKGKPLGRSSRLAGDLSTLTQLVPYVTAEATGSPLPPPRSRTLQYSLMAGGGGLFMGGSFYGLLALSREQALSEQVCPGGPDSRGVCHGENLLSREHYRSGAAALAKDKTLSLALMGGGLLLGAAGLWLLPPAEQGASVGVTLAPVGNGLGVAGVLP